MRWYKGNLHTHTSGLGSTGPASPENVVRWYKDHGYDFLAITDHNVFNRVDSRELVMVRGEEVGIGLVHVNAFGISRSVEFVDAGDVVLTMQASVDAILDAGGVASLNHPNYRWGFNHKHITRVTGPTLMEVFNGGGPVKNNDGGPGRPSCEEIWDGVLSAGQRIYGIAADDAHTYDDLGPDRANPGRGWVHIRANELTEGTILSALASGDFYASTGVTLVDIDISSNAMSLAIEPDGSEQHATRFIGRNGTVVSEQVGPRPSYVFEGNEGYVRATVQSSSGGKAWTQPFFL